MTTPIADSAQSVPIQNDTSNNMLTANGIHYVNNFETNPEKALIARPDTWIIFLLLCIIAGLVYLLISRRTKSVPAEYQEGEQTGTAVEIEGEDRDEGERMKWDGVGLWIW